MVSIPRAWQIRWSVHPAVTGQDDRERLTVECKGKLAKDLNVLQVSLHQAE